MDQHRPARAEGAGGLAAPGAGPPVAWFPLPPSLAFSAPSHPLQAKEAPNLPHPPRGQVGKVGLIFRFLYCGLTLPYIKNSSRRPGRPPCPWMGSLHPASCIDFTSSCPPTQKLPCKPLPGDGELSTAWERGPDLQVLPSSWVPTQRPASSAPRGCPLASRGGPRACLQPPRPTFSLSVLLATCNM